jgi:hypothetical protein
MTEDHIIKAVQSPPTACIAVQVRNQNEKSPWKTVFPKGLLVVLLTRPGLEPGITESKSVVLPITLSGYAVCGEC